MKHRITFMVDSDRLAAAFYEPPNHALAVEVAAALQVVMLTGRLPRNTAHTLESVGIKIERVEPAR